MGLAAESYDKLMKISFIAATLVLFSLAGVEMIALADLADQPEIDQNQEDEISRTIIIHLEDGITSSEKVKPVK